MKKFNAEKLLIEGKKMRSNAPLHTGMYKLVELKRELVSIESKCHQHFGLRKSAVSIGINADVVFRDLSYKLLPATEALEADGVPPTRNIVLTEYVEHQIMRIADFYDQEMQSVETLCDLVQRMLFVVEYVLDKVGSEWPDRLLV